MFVYQRLAALAQLEDVKVCSPAPWFPVLKKNTSNDYAQKCQELTVYRPGFFYFPGFMKNSDAWLYARGLKAWFKTLCETWKPDILDAHFIWPDGVGVALLAKELGIPYVITLRGKIYECLKVPSQTRQCAEALQGATAVISVSSKMADEALSLGASKDRVFVIPNGVNLEQFKPQDKLECRELLGLSADIRYLVTVAHLGHRKGHHEVIQALRYLPENVNLIIVGGAAQGDTPEKLQAVARDAGVADRLILADRQPYDQIPLYYNAADASVLASYREGCPNVVLESLACGTPVVATDVGAVSDILPVPDTGCIVPVQEIESLGDAIADVLSRSWNAADVVRDSGVCSWTQVAADVRTVLRDCI